MFYKNANIYASDCTFHKGAFEVTGDRFGEILPNDVPQDAIVCGELKADTPVANIAREIAFSLTGANCYFSMTGGAFDPPQWCDHYCKEELPRLLAAWYVEK